MTSISELVKRLDERASNNRHDGWELGNDPSLLEEAARALESLEAERANVRREYDFYRATHATYNDADRRVEEERERCCSIISSLGYENDEDGFAQECISAIRARSNGAQVTGGEDNGVTARSTASSPIEQQDLDHADGCAPANVEKVTLLAEQWQDIRTADKSKHIIALAPEWDHGRTPIVLHWFKYNGTEAWRGDDGDAYTPTHHLPYSLPKALGSDDRTDTQNVSVNQSSPISQEGSIEAAPLSEGGE